ncbi:hypothetical protein [Desulfovibrio litoralis]|uniref:NlpC/P60 family protein n=1 Tax=Desulfovibrio litoralis DSM 11393 TaxID=1121455 RepID=A0A1M7RVF7_9BACT|nr:hypothetical protein [Desulfovibrio litoralis]SHN50279.1 hypothetical protein SAMN02745728_00225 [Desulfovibrio litoralis DSM 11393]
MSNVNKNNQHLINYKFFIFILLFMLNFVLINKVYAVDTTKNIQAIETINKFLLGIPYRDDGALDFSKVSDKANTNGRYTLFADQNKTLKTPGLNCSGFVLAASNKIFRPDLNIDTAKFDRKNDNSETATRAEDWDFGLDLLLNISDGKTAKVMLPNNRYADPKTLDGISLPDGRGFSLHDKAAWNNVISRMKNGYIYLWAMSRKTPDKPLQYHHVGLILTEGTKPDSAFMYHAVRKGGVVKLDLKKAGSLERIFKAYPKKDGIERYIYILEVEL